ncbi:MAG: hypothetical protein PHH26_03030 [Candidatus Thermoplasmatota archaeon]|nr:hypothetical protein [Candidatus Thermoplasmatota archaeon]
MGGIGVPVGGEITGGGPIEAKSDFADTVKENADASRTTAANRNAVSLKMALRFIGQLYSLRAINALWILRLNLPEKTAHAP